MSGTLSSLGRSDDLPGLLRLLQTHPSLAGLATLPPRLRLIADTNLLLNDLRWYHLKRNVPHARTSFLEAIQSGIATVYAPGQVRAEVLDHFEEFHQEFGIPLETLQANWRPYESAIKWLNPRRSKTIEREILRRTDRDPTDAPCVTLSIQIGAGVLSADPDYASFGVAYYQPKVAGSLRGHARATVKEIRLRLGAAGVLGLSGGLTVAAVKAFGKLSPRAQLLCAGTLLATLVHKDARSWLLGNLKSLKGVGIELFGEFAAELNLASTERAGNPIAHLEPAKSQTLADYVALAVAESAAPVTAKEVARRVLLEGYETRSRAFERLIGKYLNRDTRLQHTDGGWTLAPPRIPPVAGDDNC